MTPRLLNAADIDPFMTHLGRHLAESGQEGTPIFGPYEPDEPWPVNEKKAEILGRWSRPLTEPGWEWAWAIERDGKFIAHLDLRARGLAACLHRPLLGMGIEAPYRRQGLGRVLIQTAISWAKAQPGCEWIDLYVFAHNTAARALYAQSGFIEVGEVRDMFRVAGQSIDDVAMTYPLKRGLNP